MRKAKHGQRKSVEGEEVQGMDLIIGKSYYHTKN